MMRPIENMSILVTGGGSGLGAGIARYYTERGAKVTICGRREDKIKAVARELGPNCRGEAADVAKDADRRRIIAAAVEHGGKLDALVNNAGNMLHGPITGLDEQELINVFHVNVVAGMQLTGLAVPHLEKTQGAVAFIGSVHTRRAYPGASAYAATKGAVEALTKVLAAELGPKQIRVNCVVPGAVPTEINIRAGLFTEEAHAKRMQGLASSHVLGRIGSEEDVAEAMDYCLRANWCTGHALVIDGGLSLGQSNFS
jgi:3-oxoacyl-[acyl-carrier protein] reductase